MLKRYAFKQGTCDKNVENLAKQDMREHVSLVWVEVAEVEMFWARKIFRFFRFSSHFWNVKRRSNFQFSSQQNSSNHIQTSLSDSGRTDSEIYSLNSIFVPCLVDRFCSFPVLPFFERKICHLYVEKFILGCCEETILNTICEIHVLVQ